MLFEFQFMYSFTLAVAMLISMAGHLTCRKSARYAWYLMTMTTGSAFMLSLVVLVMVAVRS